MEDKIIDKLMKPIITAFGLVVALAWNNAVKNLFNKYYATGEGVLAMFTYAIVITIIVLITILILEKFSDKAKKVDLKKTFRIRIKNERRKKEKQKVEEEGK